MPYYGAGDYYRAGGGNYAAGSIFGKVWGGIKKVAKGALGMTPVGRVVETLLPTPAAAPAPREQMGPPTPTREQASRGVAAVGMSPMGTIGIDFRRTRRMNAGNAKAARRAIRRIKGIRHLLQSIEKELPRRPALRGSAGVITRAEAARALRK